MSENDRVIWSEGMFLRPHHYQQYTRYLENFVEDRSAALRTFPWGFTELQLDQKLLGLGKLAISHAHGVFQDGTPFAMPAKDNAPLALEVPENTKESIIYLCLPFLLPMKLQFDKMTLDDNPSMLQDARLVANVC